MTFHLETKNRELMKDPKIRKWLRTIERKIAPKVLQHMSELVAYGYTEIKLPRK